MMEETPIHKVLLPEWIWEQAKDNKDFQQLILNYMKRYPHYSVKSVKDGMAICHRK